MTPPAEDDRRRTRPWGRIGRAPTAVLVALSGAVVAVVLGRRRVDRAVERRVDDLLAAADSPADRRFTRDDLAALPAPVRRYLSHVLTDGRPRVRTVRLRQRGAIRLGGAGGRWRPFVATQHVTTRPPGFVWDATVVLVPPLSVRVLDASERGEGRLRARLLGVLPVARAGPDPRMNEGELLRYLAEAVWYPTALLPAGGVAWEAIDDRSARATLHHRGVTASVVFRFDDGDEVERVTAERYRAETDRYEPWTGRFRTYRDRDGIRVPVEAAVGWGPDGGDRYWRGTIEGIEYGGSEVVAGDEG
ncbi:MAG: DUF6544 family protein [Haloferacaceae archaeon]